MIKLNTSEEERKVRAALAAAGSPACLVGFEAVEIQRFVTANSRPIAMHGASDAVHQFDKMIEQRPEAVFAGGGRGVLVVPERSAGAYVDDLKSDFQRMTHGSPLAVAAVPFDPRKEGASLTWLWLALSSVRDACEPERFDLDFSRGTCVDCRARPAAYASEKPDSPGEHVCERCYRMVRHGREKRGDARWTLTELGDPIAVVCADGNQLGQFFRSLKSLVALRLGSQAVARVFATAHAEALHRAGDPAHVAMVAGGDDLKSFLPSVPALTYIESLLAFVENEAAEIRGVEGALAPDSLTRLRELGVGIGLFVADARFPASRLVEQARRLERDAKKLYAKGRARSAVAFAILPAGGELEDARDDRDEGAHVRNGASRDPARENRRRSTSSVPGTRWAGLVGEARALALVPTSQRAAAADAWGLPDAEVKNRFLYQLARSEAWKAWFRECGVDWRDRAAVCERIPDPGMLALARLIDAGRSKGTS
jgi:hypothetical protein